MMTRSVLAPYVPTSAVSQGSSKKRWSTNGTLAFCDISGFTRLSERLATLGRLGAEEVTAAIDHCFDGLIDVVFERGGDILSFGGDALLAWFTGPDHAETAVDASVAMQRWVTANGRADTSRGSVKLRMSIGVASGSAQFVLAGRQSSELIVLGGVVDATLRCEASARPGDVLVDESSAAQVPGISGRRSEAGLVVNKSVWTRGSVTPAPPPTRSMSTDVAWESFVLPRLRREVEGDEHQSQHLSGAVAFVRVSNRTGGRSAAESFEMIEHIADRSGVNILGTDVDVNGFKVLLAAGIPDGADRRRERVVNAAHEISVTLNCASGVSYGTVFAGDVGNAQRRTWTVMGDVVNTAARLASSADPGVARVAASVAETLSDTFAFSDHIALELKGKLEPFLARDALDVAVVTQSPGSMLPLLGRDAELRAIIDSPTRVAEVIAENGLGRTRLLVEAANILDDSIWCAGTPSGQTRGWSAIQPLIAWALEDRRSISSKERSLLETLGGHGRLESVADMPSIATRAALVFDRLLTESNPQPAIVLDDLAWSDRLSRQVVDSLTQSGRTRIVVGRRPDDSSAAATDITTVVLGPLDDEAIEMIAITASRRPLSDHTLAEIVSLAAGVPQHAVALGLHRSNDLPGSIEEMRATAFDALSTRDRHRLRVAAVAGYRVEPALLREITDDAGWNDEETLERLDAFLIDGSDGWHFRHEADRQAAYLGMPVRTRRRLHADLATHMAEFRTDPLTVAQHAIDAGDDTLTAQYAPAAAAHAAERAAWFEANSFSAHAARTTVDPTKRCEFWSNASLAAESCGLPDEAESALRQAIAASTDPLEVATLWSRRALIARRSGRFSLSLRWSTFGINALTSATDGLDAERLTQARRRLGALHLERAATLIFQDRLDEAADAIEAARALSELTRNRSDWAQVLILKEMHFSAIGDPSQAASAAVSALPILLAEGNLLDAATILINRGAERGEAGDWTNAIDLLTQARERFHEIGHVLGEAVAESNLCGLLVEQGHVESATAGFRRVERVASAASLPDLAAFAGATLGRLDAWAGRHESARQRLTDALAVLPSDGDPSLAVWAHLFGAESALLAGEAARAQQHLDLLTGEVVEHLPTAWATWRRLSAALQPDPSTALRSALAEARRDQVGIEIVQTLRTLHVIVGLDDDEMAEVEQWCTSLEIMQAPPICVIGTHHTNEGIRS